MGAIERIAILGATGSIGEQTLDVVRKNPDRFGVFALSGFTNLDRLADQVREFAPKMIAVRDVRSAERFRAEFPEVEVLVGEEGLIEIATANPVSIVVGAIVGFACLPPVFAAVRKGKAVAIANKECLVGAGELLMREVRANGGAFVPVDSEHSSIFQCLRGHSTEAPASITLTASGGPFLHRPIAELSEVTPEEATDHPRWSMGPKISVDSATLMNKGLEVIEAFHLFAISPKNIRVLIHPESIVHGLVNFADGAVLACLYATDMRMPISYAMGYCSGMGRIERNGVKQLDLAQLGELKFQAVDHQRFPALSLCYEVLEQGGLAPLALNASNEIAVDAFLKRQIGFLDIISVVREVLSRFQNHPVDSMEMVLESDRQIREIALRTVTRFQR